MRRFRIAVSSFGQRTAALRDASVDYGGANTPLGGIVGRRDGWIEQESENRCPVLDQPSGQSSRLGTLAKGVHHQKQRWLPAPCLRGYDRKETDAGMMLAEELLGMAGI